MSRVQKLYHIPITTTVFIYGYGFDIQNYEHVFGCLVICTLRKQIITYI